MEEAKKVPLKSKVPHDQSRLIPEPHMVQKDLKLDTNVLKEELTQENYVKKFCNLLICEENEHDKILNEK